MTIQEQYENLEKTVRGYNPAADFQHIRAAFEFAAEAHKDQKRKSGEPYIIHPLAVAQIVAEELRLDSESIEAALLHDVIEDTAATHEQVSKLFSPTIADLVEGVSKLTRIQYATKEDEQMENLRKMLIAMSKDIRVLGHDSQFTIKADRQKTPPWGLFGGQPGLPGVITIYPGTDQEAVIDSKKSGTTLKSGGVLRCQMPGAGGYGNPLERDRALIVHDLEEGYITGERSAATMGLTEEDLAQIEVFGKRDEKSMQRFNE